MAQLKVEKLQLHLPTLDVTASVLQRSLQKNFAEVQVNVVDCPDLRKEPFTLVAEGLGGNNKILDVGGVPNLTPKLKKEKIYNLDDVAELVGSKGAFLIGAGAGPYKTVGVNSEMMANVRTKGGDQKPQTGTYVATVETSDGSCKLCQLPQGCNDFALMANLLASDGKPGKVLEVKARRRTGEINFVDAMRFGLKDHFGNEPVGLGGTFAVLQGKAHTHVMPDFPTKDLATVQDIDNWLHFYDMTAPLVFLGVLISHDPGYDLRMEHFHGFGHHGEGGHYHWDVTPDEIEYLGYFVLSDVLYRVDRATVD